MTQVYQGSFIHIEFDANELSDGRVNIQLADDGNEYNVIPSDQFK